MKWPNWLRPYWLRDEEPRAYLTVDEMVRRLEQVDDLNLTEDQCQTIAEVLCDPPGVWAAIEALRGKPT